MPLKMSSQIVLFLIIHLISSNIHIPIAMGSITDSGGEPDWSISKADLVNALYSYEPYAGVGGGPSTSGSTSTGREFRSIFPLFRPSTTSSTNNNQRRITNNPNQRQKPNYPNPLSLFLPLGLNNGQNNQNQNNVQQQKQQKQQQQQQQQQQQHQQQQQQQQQQRQPNGWIPPLAPQINKDEYRGQPPLPPSQPSQADQPIIKLLPESNPKYTKFSLEDKKVIESNAGAGNGGYQSPAGHYLPSITSTNPTEGTTTGKPGQGPIYGHPSLLNNPNPTVAPPPQPPPTSPSNQNLQNNENNGGYDYPPLLNMNTDSSSVDSQTIIWPKNKNFDENLATENGEETQVRFLVHKPGDENIIRNALLEDGKQRNQDVKFIEGPTLRIQRHQKVYLPPKKKTVVYILLKEPQIITDVEVVGPTEDPVPEVFITYQKSDGVVKTKHYSPETVKNDKYLSQLKDSAQSAMSGSGSGSGSGGFGNEGIHGGIDIRSGSGTSGLDLNTKGNSFGNNYYGVLNSFNVDEQQQSLQSSASITSPVRVLSPSPNSNRHLERVHIRSVGDQKEEDSSSLKDGQKIEKIMCPGGSTPAPIS